MVHMFLPFCHHFLSSCIWFLFRHLSSPYCRLVVSQVSKRRKKRHTYDFLFTIRIIFCLLSSFSVIKYFVPFSSSILVVDLQLIQLVKNTENKNNLPMAFFIFCSWFTCSCPFVVHRTFRSFIIPIVDLQLTQLVKYTQKRRKKTTYLLHFSFFVHSSHVPALLSSFSVIHHAFRSFFIIYHPCCRHVVNSQCKSYHITHHIWLMLKLRFVWCLYVLSQWKQMVMKNSDMPCGGAMDLRVQVNKRHIYFLMFGNTFQHLVLLYDTCYYFLNLNTLLFS